jgi:hypothetical protein
MTSKKFEIEFRKVLKAHGIIIKGTMVTVDTILGALFISCHEDWIAMRFADDDFNLQDFYAKFSQEEIINPYSFKWNIFANYEEDVLDELDNRLSVLL